MDLADAFAEVKALLVSRLRFEPARLEGVTLDTALPKGVAGSIGLDSLDFIELALALEERFGIAVDDAQDLAPHFASFGTLCRFIVERAHPR